MPSHLLALRKKLEQIQQQITEVEEEKEILLKIHEANERKIRAFAEVRQLRTDIALQENTIHELEQHKPEDIQADKTLEEEAESVGTLDLESSGEEVTPKETKSSTDILLERLINRVEESNGIKKAQYILSAKTFIMATLNVRMRQVGTAPYPQDSYYAREFYIKNDAELDLWLKYYDLPHEEGRDNKLYSILHEGLVKKIY